MRLRCGRYHRFDTSETAGLLPDASVKCPYCGWLTPITSDAETDSHPVEIGFVAFSPVPGSPRYTIVRDPRETLFG